MNQTATAPEQITAEVVARFDECPDPRLREIMQALVRHLHGFALEVRLREAEWAAAVRILTETGRITTEQRQEFILWSDTLGLSMLVDAIEHPISGSGTESTVLGPFYVADSPLREFGASVSERPVQSPAWVWGRVFGIDGSPIAGAQLDVWQNGEDRMYAVQTPEAPEGHLRGRYRTREDGSYAFLGVRPLPYTVPDDGPVGQMFEATARHPWRPAHIHLIVSAPGFQKLTTHIFDSESDYLDSDTVFAVKPSLVREFVPRAADDPERPAGVTGPWFSVENNIVLVPASGVKFPLPGGDGQGEGETRAPR
jgi:hydroxyquinol 1,2-dioxygenase